LRFLDLRLAGLPLDADDLAKNSLPGNVSFYDFNGVEKR